VLQVFGTVEDGLVSLMHRQSVFERLMISFVNKMPDEHDCRCKGAVFCTLIDLQRVGRIFKFRLMSGKFKETNCNTEQKQNWQTYEHDSTSKMCPIKITPFAGWTVKARRPGFQRESWILPV
jgi:hypothetical protein